tara:strand:- start:1337 stop:2383 length:1047 start_codon:yes stop_codon:yes gene_type:complete
MPQPPSPEPSIDDWSDLVDIHQRLDSTVMFSMIRFVYGVFEQLYSDSDIAVVCVVALVFSSLGMRFRTHLGTQLLLQVAFSLSSALLSQAIINIATQNSRIMSLSVHSTPRLLVDFVVVTSLLLAAAIIPPSLSRLPYINRAITILLYMYTDATEYIIERLDMSIAPTFISVLLYIVIVAYRDFFASAPTLSYLIRAVNMVSINVVLSSLGAVGQENSNRYTLAVLLVIVLFIIDALHRVTGMLQEGRDFAVWKGSKLIFEVYQTMDISTLATLALGVVFIVAKHVSRSSNSTIVEIFLLVAVNAILDSLSDYTSVAYDIDTVLMLFIYVVTIHSISNFISDARKGAK